MFEVAHPHSNDQRFMRAALNLGQRNLGQTGENPSVGALVVKDGVVVGRGVTAVGGRPHGETLALQQAGAAAKGATLYVTLEPCAHVGKTPPCVDAIIAAGIARVVVSVDDPDPRVNGLGYHKLQKAGITVVRHVLEAEGLRQHEGHLCAVRYKRPFITLKMAVSVDMCIAAAGGRPIAITSERANKRVHMLRAQSSAIAVGINTILNDAPLLTVRLAGLEGRSPHRLILDSDLRLPLSARVVQTASKTPTTVFTNQSDSEKARQLRSLGVSVADIKNLPQALLKVGGTRLLLEGGAETAQRFLQSGLIDRVLLFTNHNLRIDNGLKAFANVDNEKAAIDYFSQYSFIAYQYRYADDDMVIRFEKPVTSQ